MHQFTRPVALATALALCAAPAAVGATQQGTQPTPNALPGTTPVTQRATPPSGGPTGRGSFNILVYDNNTQHQLAQTAATNIDPIGTVVATATDFDTQLAVGGWDIVVVDCPSTVPTNGFTALANYVAAGNKCIVSFWDWDGTVAAGTPALKNAMEVTAGAAGSISWGTSAIIDSGTSGIFAGVTMPNSDWHSHWGDDGDQFGLSGTAIGLAHIGTPTRPVVALGNSGTTIASSVFDEAGDTWINSGEAVVLWENMINLLLGTGCPSAASAEVVRVGVPANPIAFMPGLTSGPVLGQTWDPWVDHTAFMPGAVIDAMGLTIGTLNFTIPGWGTLLCDITTGATFYFAGAAGVPFALPVPNDCSLLGLGMCSQAGSVDAGGAIGLTNALDITLGSI